MTVALNAPERCWCGMKLHSIAYGGQDWLQCPSHGSAYKEDAEKKILKIFF